MAINSLSNNPSYSDVLAQINNQQTNTTNATNTTNSTNTTNTGSTSPTGMSKDDFLKLFITSLQNQDPTNPMDTGQMMQQMAMLGLMEQTTNMTTAVDALQKSQKAMNWQEASNLIGKEVEATDSNGKMVSGGIQEVVNNNGSMYVLLDNNDTVALDQILSLKNGNGVSGATSSTVNSEPTSTTTDTTNASSTPTTGTTTDATNTSATNNVISAAPTNVVNAYTNLGNLTL